MPGTSTDTVHESPDAQAPPGAASGGPSAVLTAVLALLSFVMPMATDMYLPAFPRIAADLGTDASGVQLTLTAFLVGLAVGQLLLGPLSDRWGRRGLILTGTAVCAVSTALCAAVPALWPLVVLRFVTGVSGAAGIVLGRAVISDLASGAVAARLFGVLMALGGIAPIAAPLVGGTLFEVAGWRVIFLALGGAVGVMLLCSIAVVPESLPPERRRHGGVREMLAGIRTVASNRVYVGYTLAFGFAFGVLFCYIAASPFLYQVVLGLTVGQASAVFAAGALVATVSSAVSAHLVGRVAPLTLLQVGLALLVVSTAGGLVVERLGLLDRALAFGLLAVTFVGVGQVFGNATALAIERVPEASGTGSALMGVLQSGLGALAAPLMGLAGQASATPLYVGMTTCAVVAAAALLLTRERRDDGARGSGRGSPVSASA